MKIIINADDFGINQRVNRAIADCFAAGFISNTTIMANMPGTAEAIAIAKQEGFFEKVGLHLNLIEGAPLTDDIRNDPMFCNAEGLFHLQIPAIKRYFFSANFLQERTRRALEKEIKAQIKWYLDQGFSERHLDSHQSTHAWNLILSAILPIFQQYGMKTMRPRYSDFQKNFLKDRYRAFINHKVPHAVDALYDDKTFAEHYKELNPKAVYEVMAHPDYLNHELIDNVSGIRIESITREKDVQLLSYADL